jgi:hypothetical protein
MSVCIEAVRYVQFVDMTLDDFHKEAIAHPDQVLTIVQYRCLFARIWLHCYSSPLEMDDDVCLFRYQLLPDIDV